MDDWFVTVLTGDVLPCGELRGLGGSELGAGRLEDGGDWWVDSGIGGGGFGEAVEFPIAEGFNFLFVT